MDLGQIMHHAVKQPLRVYLLFASQAEPVESQDGSYMRKGRFCYCQPATVNETSRDRVNLAPHFGCERFRFVAGGSLEEINLSHFAALRTAQTLPSQLTIPAISLGSAKLDSPLASDHDITTVPI